MIKIYNNKLKSQALTHYNSLKEHIKKSRYNYNDIDDWFKNNGAKKSFKEIVTGNFSVLEDVKDKYITPSKKYPKYIQYLVTIYNNHFSKAKSNLDGNGYNALEMVQNIGIIVCPYCNRNYISNVNRVHRGKKRTSHLDHFFNKKTYPFLAMSFFNLVPSCPSCNHTKHKDNISVSPYDDRIDLDTLINFRYIVKSGNFLNNHEDIQVVLSYKNQIKDNVENLGLADLYSIHRDSVYEILKKGQIYNKEFKEELIRNHNHLFNSEEEINRLLYGNFLDNDNLHKRPLAKLNKDIFENYIKN
ncbi:hypothetical protein [Anaerobacillus sp. 1_MG-2023]|uniref:hypothetical protein n=1 Tax=Anaerobacillus sp. 1_MG-2023 TaxID=3062655 RepID=UPI0026E347C2|nr:hypothetical protein [Anaerobacillus sp. 1_MG-2023]MDO6658656.1 hypothetical protein [Anaerobacillus sp. 1_MG-2023]